jgi:serine/threonine protein kinase
LQDLHAAGFAHRDVKPSNVLWLEGASAWQLFDFSSTARIGSRALVVVSPVYMPPEVAALVAMTRRGQQMVDDALDIWALGLMAWSMLCRELPWVAATATCENAEDACATVRSELPCGHFEPLMRRTRDNGRVTTFTCLVPPHAGRRTAAAAQCVALGSLSH